jgi:hypothetical protein
VADGERFGRPSSADADGGGETFVFRNVIALAIDPIANAEELLEFVREHGGPEHDD